MGRLEGKVAVVTGAASGLGLAILERFVTEGAHVVGLDLQPGAARDGVTWRRCDVTDDQALKAAVDFAADRFSGLDILVNNAGGTGGFARVDDVKAYEFDTGLALLLRSVVMGTRHAVPHLRTRGGGVVLNMASAGGMTPGSTRFVYATAKAAVIHYSKEAALQLAPDLIRVNAIAPGMIPTPHVARAMGADEAGIAEAMARATAASATAQPLPIGGLPGDVAEACVWLASDAARFVTGVVLPVDGGASAGR
jgi:NAD(P)-dependent dehydrogenase (short-subunit alcohol dehydrogenase family)